MANGERKQRGLVEWVVALLPMTLVLVATGAGYLRVQWNVERLQQDLTTACTEMKTNDGEVTQNTRNIAVIQSRLDQIDKSLNRLESGQTEVIRLLRSAP